jgi:large subunit ribosomal protein L19
MKSVLMDKFEKSALAGKKVPDFHVGDTVRVHQRISEAVVREKLSKTAKAIKKAKEEEAGKKTERIQIFEGVVIAKKHGAGLNATFTVRKLIGPYGVEKIYPLNLPTIDKVEVVKRAKVRQAKLYYLRKLRGKKAKFKEKAFAELVADEEKPKEAFVEEQGAAAGGKEATSLEPADSKAEGAAQEETEVKDEAQESAPSKEVKKGGRVSKLFGKFKKS